ncbi:MAG: single-stranded DNA-binding protein [Oscillospiraceae bacterium]|jgi:single-strand DNA-binding protein|nr:single-stranded DNA-binding protein [Oscillospiraceae bacterium]
MNIVHLLGRLTADTELKYTTGNTAYCRFRIAVNRKFAKEGDVSADFFNVVSWNKQAEFVSRHFIKGERIIVHGEIRNSDYTDKNNIKHYGVEIFANSLEFADTKASKHLPTPEVVAAAPPETPTVGIPDDFEEMPF